MVEEALEIVIKARDEAEKTLGGVSGNLGKIGLAAAAAGGAILAGLAVTVKAASEAQTKLASMDATLATMGKTGTDAREGILKAASAAVQLGFDDEDAAQSISKLFQRTKDLTEATKLNSLAMDLSRAKNLDLSTASNLVGMVLSGNGRVLKQYGIDLKEAGTPMQALTELQGKLAGQATAFSKTWAGQMQVLDVQIDNVKETIGAQLLPVLTKLLQQVTPMIQKVLDWTEKNPELTKTIVLITAAVAALLVVVPALVGAITAIASPIGLAVIAVAALVAAGVWLYENWNMIKDKAAAIWQPIAAFLTSVFDAIKAAVQTVAAVFKAVWDGIVLVVKFAIALMLAAIDALLSFFDKNWKEHLKMALEVFAKIWEDMKAAFDFFVTVIVPKIQAFLSAIITAVTGFSKPIIDAFSTIWNAVADAAKAAFDGIKSVVEGVVNWMIDKINTVINALNTVAAKGASVVGMKPPQIPTIPKLADGGIVSRPTLAMIGEAGPEAVVPLSRMGNMGAPQVSEIHIMEGANVTIKSDQDARQLAQVMYRELARLMQQQRMGLSTSR